MIKLTYFKEENNPDSLTEKTFNDNLDLIDFISLKGIKDEQFDSISFGDKVISGGINGLRLYALNLTHDIRELSKENEEAEEAEDDDEDDGPFNDNDSFNDDKDEYIRGWAENDYEVGTTMDPDDFRLFRHIGLDDGYYLTEEDFDKYFEYLENFRAGEY